MDLVKIRLLRGQLHTVPPAPEGFVLGQHYPEGSIVETTIEHADHLIDEMECAEEYFDPIADERTFGSQSIGTDPNHPPDPPPPPPPPVDMVPGEKTEAEVAAMAAAAPVVVDDTKGKKGK
jgi:hypothetical protein